MKHRKVKKGVIVTQIIGMLLFLFIVAGVTFAAINTKELSWIITSIILIIIYILMLLQEINIIKEAAGFKVKHTPVYVWLIVFIIIMSFLGVSTLVLIEKISIRLDSEKTFAYIYDIDKEINYKTEYDEDGNSYEVKEERCKNYINYIVNGKKYDGILDDISCKYLIDDKISIRYDKNNPSLFIEPGGFIGPIIGVLISLLSLICLIYSTVKELKEKKVKRKLRKHA